MRRTIQLLCPIALSALASAQTALLREGDNLAGAFAGQVTGGINVAGVSQDGGYACTFSSSGPLGTLSMAFGAPTGAEAPDVFLAEMTVGALVQTSWETLSFGLTSAGELVYSASGTGGPAGGFDSVWRDDVAVAVEGDPIPTLPGKFWRFASRPKALLSGETVFVGGITSTSGGATEERALFRDADVILRDGDVIPGLPAPLTTTGSTVSFDFQFSADGAHYLSEVQMGGLTTSDDGAMVFDGAGLLVDGTVVQEGTTLPANAGGLPGENWDNFDFVAVTNDGSYLLTGDSDADTALDEHILIDGVIIHREGDTLDGEVLTGSIEGADMNENGDYAFIWDVVDGTGNVEALYLNGALVLKEGDEVDLDGDGVLDPGTYLQDFTGGSQLAVAEDGTVFFTADIDTLGTIGTSTDDTEAFFRLSVSVGSNYCTAVANSTGSAASISASGSTSVAANDLVLSATPVPADQNGIFFYGPEQTEAPFGNGNICIGTGSTGIGRLDVENSGAGGVLTHAVDYTSPPSATTQIVPGSTWHFSTWFRDPAAMGAFFNLSDGLTLQFLP